MERKKPLFFAGLFIFFVSMGLARFDSAHVRPVDAVGLFGSGMGCGAAVFGFVHTLRARSKT